MLSNLNFYFIDDKTIPTTYNNLPIKHILLFSEKGIVFMTATTVHAEYLRRDTNVEKTLLLDPLYNLRVHNKYFMY